MNKNNHQKTMELIVVSPYLEDNSIEPWLFKCPICGIEILGLIEDKKFLAKLSNNKFKCYMDMCLKVDAVLPPDFGVLGSNHLWISKVHDLLVSIESFTGILISKSEHELLLQDEVTCENMHFTLDKISDSTMLKKLNHEINKRYCIEADVTRDYSYKLYEAQARFIHPMPEHIYGELELARGVLSGIDFTMDTIENIGQESYDFYGALQFLLDGKTIISSKTGQKILLI